MPLHPEASFPVDEPAEPVGERSGLVAVLMAVPGSAHETERVRRVGNDRVHGCVVELGEDVEAVAVVDGDEVIGPGRVGH